MGDYAPKTENGSFQKMTEQFKSFWEPGEFPDMPRIDATLDTGDINIDPINSMAILDRISFISSQLKPHESYISHLGVAAVRIDALPNSTRVNICPNDEGMEATTLYITLGGTSFDQRRYIHAALSRYLLPMLED